VLVLDGSPEMLRDVAMATIFAFYSLYGVHRALCTLAPPREYD